MNLFLLFALASLWGTSFLFIKIIVAEVPAFTLVAGRLGLATLLLHLILRFRGVTLPRDKKIWQACLILGFFDVALPFSLISWGEQHISSGMASLLVATVPIFTVFLAHFTTDDDRLTWRKLMGVLVGFSGVGVLFLPDLQAGRQESVLGQLAVVTAAFFYAACTLFARKRLQEVPPLITTTGQFTAAFAIMLPLSLLFDRPFGLSPSWQALASWVGLTLLGTVIAYLLFFTLIRRANATFVSMYTYILPVNGLLLGALVLGEPLSPVVLLSLAMVLLGVLLVRS